jgi:hypothetical protein
MTSDHTHNLFPLHVTHGEQQTQVWCNFLTHVEHACEQLWGVRHPDDYEPYLEAHAIQILASYGAHTDWDAWDAPVWFTSAEQLTTFVLTYS